VDADGGRLAGQALEDLLQQFAAGDPQSRIRP
jgi:hypothetical protein